MHPSKYRVQTVDRLDYHYSKAVSNYYRQVLISMILCFLLSISSVIENAINDHFIRWKNIKIELTIYVISKKSQKYEQAVTNPPQPSTPPIFPKAVVFLSCRNQVKHRITQVDTASRAGRGSNAHKHIKNHEKLYGWERKSPFVV